MPTYYAYCASCELAGTYDFTTPPAMCSCKTCGRVLTDTHPMKSDPSTSDTESISTTVVDPMALFMDKVNHSGDTKKLDQGKYMAGVLEDFLPALKEIAKLGSMNNKPFGKYERGSWMEVEDAERRYLDGWWRHVNEGRHNIDPESGMPHDVAIAWNSIVLVWFRLKREGKI